MDSLLSDSAADEGRTPEKGWTWGLIRVVDFLWGDGNSMKSHEII